MNFEAIARQYLSELQKDVNRALSTGAFTPELSYRPLLNNFFTRIANLINPDIAPPIFEPKLQANAGRPDWRFYNASNLGVYGYVEAKGLNTNNYIVIDTYSDQVNKYLRLRHKVILTDGIDFVFFDPKSKTPTRFSLIEKPILASKWMDLQPNLLLDAGFRSFFQDAGFRRVSEVQLITEVAKRAVELSSSIEELADSPQGSGFDEEENKTIEVLQQLKTVLENHHDPVLRTPKAFADFVAQVLVFGLLYAHRVVVGEIDIPKDRDLKMQQFWTNAVFADYSERLRPFRALIEILGNELNSLSRIGVWYGDCRLLLAYVELEDKQRKNPDYHTLYEKFLSVFDPKTRFDYGAFYTPRELAEFAVLLTQAIVKTEIPGISLYETGNKLIDPCCGTGTFLEQLIVLSQDSASLAQIIGFEILPAPYALAHYRLAMMGNKGNNFQNLSIILTNTLCDELEQENIPKEQSNKVGLEVVTPQQLIDEEQAIARRLAKPPLTLVIGNPPSSDSSPHTDGLNFKIIQALLDDFRLPKSQRRSRQNTQKQTQNDFIKFLRWACDKLTDSPNGLFALVLPSSFAENPSYRDARKWVIEHFYKLWTLDIDIDARTGAKTTNLFNTMQGRMLLIGLKRQDDNAKQAQIFYHSITNLTKQQKQNELSRPRDTSSYLTMFSPITLDKERYYLRSSKHFDQTMYSRFWPLHPLDNIPAEKELYIFQRHSSGVKFGSSSLFVHADKHVLLRRCREIGSRKFSAAELKQKWFEGQDKPPAEKKLSERVREEIEQAVKKEDNSIVLYTYRPLVNLYAFISEPVLYAFSKVSGGTRPRPEVMRAFQEKTTIGIAVAPSPKDVSDKLQRFASFCWTTPDNDLCTRVNAHIFCNQFPEYKKSNRPWNSTPIGNISPDLLQRLSSIATDISNDDIVYYVYGILCSNLFLRTFEGTLHSMKIIPRIPIPADGEFFKSVAKKGKSLAEVEKPLSAIPLPECLVNLKGLFTQPFKLARYKVEPNAQLIDLYNDNGEISISAQPIPKEILEFKISGYQVISQWLKVHSYAYTRMQFSQDQYTELLNLLAQIDTQIRIIEELDNDVSAILSGNISLM